MHLSRLFWLRGGGLLFFDDQQYFKTEKNICSTRTIFSLDQWHTKASFFLENVFYVYSRVEYEFPKRTSYISCHVQILVLCISTETGNCFEGWFILGRLLSWVVAYGTMSYASILFSLRGWYMATFSCDVWSRYYTEFVCYFGSHNRQIKRSLSSEYRPDTWSTWSWAMTRLVIAVKIESSVLLHCNP